MEHGQKQDGFSYYEKRLCILIFLSSLPNTFSPMQSLVTQYTPQHHCALTDVLDEFKTKVGITNITDNMTNHVYDMFIPFEMDSAGKLSRSQCRRYKRNASFSLSQVSSSEVLFNVSINNDSAIIPCKSWVYEGVEISAVTEFDLVCDESWKKPLAISFQFYGIMCGCAMAGYLTDRFGRKPTFLFFTYWQFIIGLCLSFAQSFTSYAIFFFLSGTGAFINYMVAAVIGSEMIRPKYRAISYFALTMGYSIGYSFLAPITFFFRDWRWFERAANAIGIFYIPYIWLIDESPKWLRSSGKSEKARRIENKIARFNKQHHDSFVKDETLTSETIEILGVWETIKKLSHKPVLVVRVLVLSLAWIGGAFAYYMTSLGNNTFVGNRFLNLFLSSLTDIFSAVVYYYGVQKMGRRESYIISGIIMALCTAAIGIFQYKNGEAVLVISMVSKFMASVAWAVAYLHSTEVIPTKCRQSVLTLLNICSRFGGILSQYLMHASESGSVLQPCLITSGLLLLACTLYLLVPETKNIPLPETIEDATNMRSQFRLCPRRKDRNRKAEMENLKSDDDDSVPRHRKMFNNI